jgi:hypothetical protein
MPTHQQPQTCRYLNDGGLVIKFTCIPKRNAIIILPKDDGISSNPPYERFWVLENYFYLHTILCRVGWVHNIQTLRPWYSTGTFVKNYILDNPPTTTSAPVIKTMVGWSSNSLVFLNEMQSSSSQNTMPFRPTHPTNKNQNKKRPLFQGASQYLKNQVLTKQYLRGK